MTTNMIFILFGFILFFFLVFLTISHIKENHKKKQKLYAKITGQSSKDALRGKDTSSKSAEIERKLKEASADQKSKNNQKISLSMLIKQAGYQTSVLRFWVYSIIFAFFIGSLLLTLTSLSKIVLILLTFTALFGLPRFYLKWKAKKRQKAFLEEFAEALDAMSRLLKAGMPVTEAIAMAAREFQGPIGDEMSQIYENQKVGISLSDAVAGAADRMPITEMKMFATAVAIQSETGSSLSEVLENLSHVIRSRFRLKRKVVALSQEAKSSAIIIGALPILVGGGMNLIQPEYTGILFEETVGKALLWGCAIWMSIGVLVMRQMINFKV